MFDTVVASTEGYINPELFPNVSVTDGMYRYWRNPTGDVYQPRVTYWLPEFHNVGRIRIEFSIPKLLGMDLSNPTAEQAYLALKRVDLFLKSLAGGLPSITTWQAQRIDYAWNFEPSHDVAQYITMLQGLWLGRMSRHPHPDAEGVVWKSRQPNHRWVKFYNKTREARGNGTPVLRFEVSNYRRSLSYMCKQWFDCDQTVGELLHQGRALYVMARVWSKLGLFSPSYRVEGGLLMHLRHLFGNGAAGAYYALECIRVYGADTHKLHHLMSDNTYYRWQRELTKHDLLIHSDVELVPLSLPVADVLKHQLNAVAQDLRASGSGLANLSLKFPPKYWLFWTHLLQVSTKAPEISKLTRLLELEWERDYAAKAFDLGGLREVAG